MTKSINANPYNADEISDWSMFFGRSDELLKICTELNKKRPKSFAVIGGRKIGKTSLILKLSADLLENENKNYVPIYLSMDEISSPTEILFYDHLILKAVENINVIFEEPVYDTVPTLRDPYKEFLERLKQLYSQCSDQVERTTFVFFIDEFDVLLGLPWIEGTLGNLRNLIHGSACKNYVALIVTGFREINDFEITNTGSPFWNELGFIRLGVLNSNDSNNLINIPTNGRIKEDVSSEILSLTGGHPYLIQYLMQELGNSVFENISVKDALNIGAKLSESEQIFHSWMRKFDADDIKTYHLLFKCPLPMSKSEITRAIGKSSHMNLQFLKYTGVIYEEGNTFGIAGTLFERWFLDRYQIPVDPGVKKTEENESEPPSSPSPKTTTKSWVFAFLLFMMFIVLLFILFAKYPLPWYVNILISILIVVGATLLLGLLGVIEKKQIESIFKSALDAISNFGSNLKGRNHD